MGRLVRLAVVLSAVAAGCAAGGGPVPEGDAVRETNGEVGGDLAGGGAEATATVTPEVAGITEDFERPPGEAAGTVAVAATARVPLDAVDLADAGRAMHRPIGFPRVPDGWIETEFVFGGEAVRYEMIGDLTPDGFWDATEGRTAGYRTRMIVRRPPAESFSGVVLVEWLNVTAGADASPDLAYLADEIERAGHAYVAVSAQAVGIDGTDREFVAGGLVDSRGLRRIDPDRYGGLEHPGDAYSFDIFSQAGAAAAGVGNLDVLGDLTPTHLMALGQSQSAAFLTTYINAVHPLVEVFDGFLVHGRGSFGPTLGARSLPAETASVRLRTDLAEPVLIYETETDLVELGFLAARQEDTDSVRTWEVAGTAHSDAFVLAVSSGLARDASLGSLIGCETPINDGPQHETLLAALHHLVAWVVDERPPPRAPRLAIDEGAIVRDRFGVAVGGVRTPLVDAPLRVLSGEPGTPDACALFGQTVEIGTDDLTTIWVDRAAYVASLEETAAASVAAGWLLPDDVAAVIAEETRRAGEVGLG